MSSIVDRLLTSDNPDLDLVAGSRKNGAQKMTNGRSRSAQRSSIPPSESNGALSDVEGFPDDEIVGVRGTDRNRPRDPMARAVPKVVDRVGEKVAEEFENFLDQFIEDITLSGAPPSSALTSDKYYIAQIHGLRIYNLSTLYVDFQHLLSLQNQTLANAIANDYYRYLPFLTRALHNLIAKYESRYFKEHRQPTSASSQTGTSVAGNGVSQAETQGSRTTNQQTDKLFTLAFYNLPLISRIRQLRTASVGKLLSISGTVTRTSEVRPELYLATFICEGCRTVISNVEQTFRYTEPTQCPNLTCGNRQGWRLDIRQSTFVDWQKVRIQENSSEIPTGSMPRTMDVILRGEIVDRAKAGEKCVFTGTLIVIPDVSQLGLPGVRPEATRDNRNAPRGGDAGGSGVTGLKALGVRDLTYRMAFLSCMVTPDTSTPGQAANQQLNGQAGNILASLNQTASIDPQDSGDHAQDAYLQSLTSSEIEDLKQMVHSDHIYSRLVNSLAPMVYGHEIVKKGLLLQLMGGVSKVTPEGMQLRGDLNICIVGDPSTSKSQFLKYICSFLPRAVYTSGKASSAAGLTAAVVKDEETGEFTIEAGALMLADNGICAIDEFDKMDIGDQVAIHEAMEQQTISIAKAGIQATLNARTSILAAANPVGGRYNRKTTLRANINMSAPIMSRFDLFFVILDECNESVDRHLAEHIVNIHMLRDDAVQPEFTTEQLQRYIRFARTFKPEFTPEAKTLLVEKYKELRADDAQGGIGRNSYRITVRQLESMIRLSEAIAKANCVDDVTPNFVREAFNLLRQSIISVEKDDVEVEDDEDEVLNNGTANGHADGPDRDGDSPMADGDDDDQDGDNRPDGAAGRASQTPAPQSRRTKITYDKYMAILNMLVRRVNEDEMTTGEGVEHEELVTWYLEQKEEELNSVEEAEEEKELARKVIKRMVKDNIFMQIRGEGLDGDEGSSRDAEKVVGHLRWLHQPFTAVGNGTSADGISLSPFQPGLVEFWDITSHALVEAKPDCSLPSEPIEAPLNKFASLKKGFDFRPDLLKIPQQDVEKLRDAHARFVAQVPDLAQKLPYKIGTQGIVVAASGALLPVFLVSLKMLRRTGSTLPVEVFMESKKNYEKEICEIVLPPMNATCMILSEILEGVPQKLKMSRYQLKALALAFSSFDEVLLLDADNLPVEQPDHLLNSEPFLSKGFVSWPDYWANTASPKFYEISQQPIPPTSTRAASEAGQLLLSKSKHASTLLLILYYNYYGPSHYYRLLSQTPATEGSRESDKETYLAAAMSLNASYHTVTTNIETLGYTQVHDNQFKAAGLVQHNPEDDYGKNILGNKEIKRIRPSFLHANTYKLDAAEIYGVWNTEIRSQRMWGGTKEMVERFGRDLEKQVWAETLYTGCHLEHAFSTWANKTHVCKNIGRVYKFLYN